jgi:HKD family nuclease
LLNPLLPCRNPCDEPSIIQPSGLDLIQQSLFAALRAEARVRILVGDYLYITSAEALPRLTGWMSLADDIGGANSLEVRLVEISQFAPKPYSFQPPSGRYNHHPSRWQPVGVQVR